MVLDECYYQTGIVSKVGLKTVKLLAPWNGNLQMIAFGTMSIINLFQLTESKAAVLKKSVIKQPATLVQAGGFFYFKNR